MIATLKGQCNSSDLLLFINKEEKVKGPKCGMDKRDPIDLIHIFVFRFFK